MIEIIIIIYSTGKFISDNFLLLLVDEILYTNQLITFKKMHYKYLFMNRGIEGTYFVVRWQQAPFLHGRMMDTVRHCRI